RRSSDMLRAPPIGRACTDPSLSTAGGRSSPTPVAQQLPPQAFPSLRSTAGSHNWTASNHRRRQPCRGRALGDVGRLSRKSGIKAQNVYLEVWNSTCDRDRMDYGDHRLGEADGVVK